MDKLKQLISLCKATVHIDINEHRGVYNSVEEEIDDDDRKEIEDDIYSKMVETDTIIRIQAYPNTPIGFFVVYHHDLESAINTMLALVSEVKEVPNG